MRFDEVNKRQEQNIQMKIIFFSEIVDADLLSINLNEIKDLIDDGISDLIIILSDSEFDIIDGRNSGC